MASERIRSSSTGHKTLNSVAFQKSNIDDVIADISLNTNLKYIKFSTDPANPSGYTLSLEKEGLVIHIADIMLKGDKYLALLDPHYDENKGVSEGEIGLVYQELNDILLRYAPEKVRDYLERTNQENS